ncbi:hypothetical protein ACQJ1E_29610, partial [Bacillus toyonensis]
RWLPAISCPKPIHLPPTHFAFLEEGVFLAKMINFNKEHVLNKAMYLFWEKAYDATSISDLFNTVT